MKHQYFNSYGKIKSSEFMSGLVFVTNPSLLQTYDVFFEPIKRQARCYVVMTEKVNHSTVC